MAKESSDQHENAPDQNTPEVTKGGAAAEGGKHKSGRKKNGPGRHTRLMEMPGLLKYVDFDYGEFMRRKNVRVLFALIALIIAVLFGYWLSSVFVPLIAALMLAYILNPLVVYLEKKGLSRHRAVLAIFAGFFSTALLALVLIVPALISNISRVSRSAGEYPAKIDAAMADGVSWVNGYLPENSRLDPSGFKLNVLMGSALGTAPEPAASPEPGAETPASGPDPDSEDDQPEGENPDKAADEPADETPAEVQAESPPPTATASKLDAGDVKQAATSESMGVALGMIGSALNVLLFVTLLPLYTFYFMLGLSGIWDRFVSYIPPKRKKRILGVLGEIHGMLSAFFRGRLIICVIVSIMTTALFLAFGVPFAVLLGLVGGFGVIIPFFSMIASMGPALLLMSINGAPSPEILAVGLIFSAIMGLEQYFLTPKILGKAVELHPVTLLVGVFVMAHLFGVFGALMAVPLTALAKILGRELIFPYFRALVEEGEEPSQPTPEQS